ncbi:ABC transporter permease [Roseomonas fluvialis]|uniref:ABC transporter permease n=2 Tax=Roseomonas fluvialis TaxID=1750527 RepID=A0ABN6NZ57_9PROT|nr:ABC transporter permease [Roseomonas fluvialis]
MRAETAKQRESAAHTARLMTAVDRWSFELVVVGVSALALVILTAPTVVVLIASFTGGQSLRFPPQGFSLQWYDALLTRSQEIGVAFRNSIAVAAMAAAAGTMMAVAAAMALSRRTTRASRALDAAFMAPLTLPTLALGLGLLMLISIAGAEPSLVTLVVGHTIIVAPYVLRTTSASLSQLDPALVDSARTLGAGPAYAFRTVVLPLIAAGIAAGMFIGFMASFDNVSISLFLADAGTDMLPLRLWNIIENLLDVRAAAASGLLIAVTGVLLMVMERLTRFSRQMRN